MNENQLIAFRMKFQNKSIAEIAEASGFTENTIITYFSVNGNWRVDYDKWAEEEVKIIQTDARKLFEGAIEMAAEELTAALDHAKQVVKEKRKNLQIVRATGGKTAIEEAEQQLRSAENRAIEIGEKIMDRVGMGAIVRTKSENLPVDPGSKDVKQRLIDAGIDPTSIRFTSPAPARTEGTLPN